jgi:hypothetical protein
MPRAATRRSRGRIIGCSRDLRTDDFRCDKSDRTVLTGLRETRPGPKYRVLMLSPRRSTWRHCSADRDATQHGETGRADARQEVVNLRRCQQPPSHAQWRPRPADRPSPVESPSCWSPALSNSTARQNIRWHPRDAALPPVRTRHLEDPRIGQSNCRRALLPGRRAPGPHLTSRARKPRRCRRH